MSVPDRNSLDQKVLEGQQRLSAVLQTATDAVIVIDDKGLILVFSAAAERMFGCPAQEAIGNPLERFAPPRLLAAYSAAVESWRQTDAHVGSVGVVPPLWGRRTTGEEFACEASISQHAVGGRQEFTVIVRDITERKRSEEALLRRVEFEKFLFDLSRTFIGLPEEKVDTNMELGLARVAEFLQMDRVTLFEFSRDRSEMTVAYSWSAPGVANPPMVITNRHQPWWVEQTLRGEVSLASHVDDLPEEAAIEREYLRRRGVASAASIPLEVGGEIAGAISFTTVHRHEVWTEELVNQLRAIGDILWNALKRRQAMQALLAAQSIMRESEERFRLMADTAPVMIWMAGTDTLCHYFNHQWLEFTGRPLEAEVGNGWTEGVHADDYAYCVEAYLQAFGKRESFRIEYRLRRYDGEYRWVLDSGVPRFNADGPFAGYIGSAIDITDQKLAQETLSNLSQRLMQAQEEERAFIARELHDDLTQRATTLVLRLQTLGRTLPLETSERAALQELSEQAFALAKAIPALSHHLHSAGIVELGIAGAAASLCTDLSEQHNVTIDFTHHDIPEDLSEDVAICLFRVLQEALNNAIKHAGISQFSVSLIGLPNEIQLTVSDEGVGFDSKAGMKGRGLGLVSMKERLSLVNGEVVIESWPGAGTTVRARVPLSPR